MDDFDLVPKLTSISRGFSHLIDLWDRRRLDRAAAAAQAANIQTELDNIIAKLKAGEKIEPGTTEKKTGKRTSSKHFA